MLTVCDISAICKYLEMYKMYHALFSQKLNTGTFIWSWTYVLTYIHIWLNWPRLTEAVCFWTIMDKMPAVIRQRRHSTGVKNAASEGVRHLRSGKTIYRNYEVLVRTSKELYNVSENRLWQIIYTHVYIHMLIWIE